MYCGKVSTVMRPERQRMEQRSVNARPGDVPSGAQVGGGGGVRARRGQRGRRLQRAQHAAPAPRSPARLLRRLVHHLASAQRTPVSNVHTPYPRLRQAATVRTRVYQRSDLAGAPLPLAEVPAAPPVAASPAAAGHFRFQPVDHS